MRRSSTLLLLALLLSLACGCTPAVRVQGGLDGAPWLETESYTPGNAVTILSNGPDTYASMYQAIAQARHHIHIETYILCEDVIGRQLIDRLRARIEEGVAVRILYDHHGTSPCTSNRFLDRLEEMGIEAQVYEPPSDDEWVYLLRYNRRDHRKIFIVDGRIAFTGGINYDDVYASKPRISHRPEQGWRDTNVRIEGPAVAQFQKIFLRQWRALRPLPELPGTAFFPSPAPAGKAAVRALSSTGGGDNPIFRDYLRAIRHARERIWLTHSYFMPEPQLMQALTEAAARGVDVRMVLPGFSDVPLLHPIARSTYPRLLEAGIKLYERHDAFVHAKTATVDGRWSTIGSANLDYRSLLHNDEINAMILDEELAGQMEKLFLRDAGHAQRVTLAAWNRRPAKARLLEYLGLVFAYWL